MADTPPLIPIPILDALDAGVIVLDRCKRVVKWNAWMESASGHPAGKVHGQPLTSAFHSAGSGRLAMAIDSAFDAGASSLLTHALHPLIFPLRTRAGRQLLHDVMVSRIAGGAEALCLIHITDVTMAARREQYLRERQNARYDAVVSSAPDVILTLDTEGTIHLANRAAVAQFGYAEEELVGQKATLLFEAGTLWRDAWRRVIEGEKLQQAVELVARRKDGSLTHFEVSAARWQNNTHVFVTAILRDINERRAAEAALRASEEKSRIAAVELAELNATLEKRVEERTAKLLEVEEVLRQSQKMEAIGQLTGGIAHDFNNLLQGVIGALNMVQKRVEEGRITDIDRFLKGALASAARASTLTHRLLAFSRQQPVSPKPIDLNQLIASMAELLRRSIGEKIEMRLAGADDLWLVRCDTNQLENALLNLAINARDAMPEGGMLTIETFNRALNESEALIRNLKPGEHVCLTVSDTGVGMPPDVQARAFDPFYTTKPMGQGTGLGLSMIYGFIRQSEGAVRIDSEVGRGTTVEIYLPRFHGRLEAEAAAPAASGSRAGHNEVVLVVEDEDVVRLLIVAVLSDMGYHALEAADGKTAQRILNSPQRVDLLVTDIGLPDINGRQVADSARTQRPALKILFMTGYAERAASSEFLGEGMHIISKPFTMDELAEEIQSMLRRA